MPTVASVNYTTKRIYLSATTVGVPLDTLDVYREVRARRVSTEADRAFKMMIIGGGGIVKTPGVFTQQYVQLLYGCRIVPYNTTQSLVITRDTFTDDGLSGVGCFDRSSVTANVDIDIQVSPVEVREVVTGGGSGGLTGEQEDQLAIAAAANPWATLLEGGLTAQDVMRVMLAVLAGKSTVSVDGTVITFSNQAADKARVTAVADAVGSRQSVTLDPS